MQKVLYTVGIAVLFGLGVAWWLVESEDLIHAVPVQAASGDSDVSPQTGGNAETPRQQGPRQHVTPSRESSAGPDVGSSSEVAVPVGTVAFTAPGTQQVARRIAAETTPEQPADTKSSEPSAIDKTACRAAAKILDESLSIFDVTPTQAVWYASSRAASPHYPPSGFTSLKERLSAPLCSGSSAFNQDYTATTEFVAISTDSHARILLGDHWISDGTVLSQLSEADQEHFAISLEGRRRQGIGPGKNISRESFERRLAQNPSSLLPGP